MAFFGYEMAKSAGAMAKSAAPLLTGSSPAAGPVVLLGLGPLLLRRLLG